MKLLPCPFCGGEAYSRFVQSKSAFGYASIECRKCGAVPYVHQVYNGLDNEDAVKGVSEAWNRRVGDNDISTH
jgi:Lar family restriction alleviation protein